MSNILPEDIEEYLRAHIDTPDLLFEEIERFTRENTENPGMLTGPVQGRFLQFLIKVSSAKYAVDVGTFTGYSALMIAEALPEDGKVITCEIDRVHSEIAKGFFSRSRYGYKIELRLAPAIDTLKTLDSEAFDFIFIDADKAEYKDYYEEGIRILRHGGIIAVDNALWSGRVLDPVDRSSVAIAEFNDYVSRDKRVEKVIIPLRDGIYLIRKK